MEEMTKEKALLLLQQVKRDLELFIKLKEKGLVTQNAYNEQIDLYLDDIIKLKKIIENFK